LIIEILFKQARVLDREKEVLQELNLPQSIKQSAKEFVLHPALMDGALRTLMGMYLASEDYAPLSIPFSLDRIKIRKAVNGKCYAYAKNLGTLDEKTSIQKAIFLFAMKREKFV